jgi:hypothetical protein
LTHQQAGKFAPLDRFAVLPQCGSAEAGNILAEEERWVLARAADIANEACGN